jgi:hypothetical protein
MIQSWAFPSQSLAFLIHDELIKLDANDLSCALIIVDVLEVMDGHPLDELGDFDLVVSEPNAGHAIECEANDVSDALSDGYEPLLGVRDVLQELADALHEVVGAQYEAVNAPHEVADALHGECVAPTEAHDALSWIHDALNEIHGALQEHGAPIEHGALIEGHDALNALNGPDAPHGAANALRVCEIHAHDALPLFIHDADELVLADASDVDALDGALLARDAQGEIDVPPPQYQHDGFHDVLEVNGETLEANDAQKVDDALLIERDVLTATSDLHDAQAPGSMPESPQTQHLLNSRPKLQGSRRTLAHSDSKKFR